MIPSNYINFYSILYSLFLNNWIFLCIRSKIFFILSSVLYKWKALLNLSFLCFFYEALYKLKPVLGYNFFLIKRKNNRKLYKLQVFLLTSNVRNKKAIQWFVKAVKSRLIGLTLQEAILAEMYSLTFFKKSISVSFKSKYYSSLINHKTSRHFLW